MRRRSKKWCLCGHGFAEHAMTWARCRGLDSYGITCTCPLAVEDVDDE